MRSRSTVATLCGCLAFACSESADHTAHSATESDAHAGESHAGLGLTWDQVAFGCAPMGEGESRHVMCNHGHSIGLRQEPLWPRWLWAKDHGIANPTEADLMHSHDLPPPLTPLLRARLGERVRLRVVSYGPLFHTFHVHGHLWVDGKGLADTKTLGPAEVYDLAEFHAGAGATSADERAGVGDWMYHCHVEPHALTGMWGHFRVLPKTGGDEPGKDGRYPNEVPPPLGAPGATVDVFVVAAEVPLVVAREYNPKLKALDTVERMARLFVPVADEAAFQAATAASVQQQLSTQAQTWSPWILSLKQGAKVRVHLRNVMKGIPVALHPHGVAYKIEHDGTNVDDVAQPGGAPVVMEWLADTPGTWPLHDHARTLENVARGLFAAIVVKSPQDEATLQRDYVVFFHDADMDWLMGSAQPSGMGH
jgi:FtsP/CotA-like multicopper oxidase with cupredoxin domain